jgi:hypothetical protein
MELLLRDVYVAELEGDGFTDAEAGPKRQKESAQFKGNRGAPNQLHRLCLSAREKLHENSVELDERLILGGLCRDERSNRDTGLGA